MNFSLSSNLSLTIQVCSNKNQNRVQIYHSIEHCIRCFVKMNEYSNKKRRCIVKMYRIYFWWQWSIRQKSTNCGEAIGLQSYNIVNYTSAWKFRIYWFNTWGEISRKSSKPKLRFFWNYYFVHLEKKWLICLCNVSKTV